MTLQRCSLEGILIEWCLDHGDDCVDTRARQLCAVRAVHQLRDRTLAQLLLVQDLHFFRRGHGQRLREEVL